MQTTQPSTNLKILVLNAENLFLLSDTVLNESHLKLDEGPWKKLSTSIYENKPLGKCRALAQVILDEKPDVVMLCEVGGHESLKNFNHLFLKDEYLTALSEGNSNRNIDIGFLIRKNLGFYFDLISNRNRSLGFLYPHEQDSLDAGLTTHSGKAIVPHKFSRDAAELHFFLSDRSKPFLVLILAHLKSRLDPENIDPSGFGRRRAEANVLMQIYLELEAKFQNKVPIAVSGDFNGNASRKGTDAEFETLYSTTSLEDVCELAQLSPEDRATYYQVGRTHRVEGRQIDYSFLSPLLQKYLDPKSVRVHRYVDPRRGVAFDPPTTLDAKGLLPSDHYPILYEIKGLPVF